MSHNVGYALVAGFAMIVLLCVTKANTFMAKLGLVGIGVATVVGMELTQAPAVQRWEPYA
jgi:hypothetical protein